MRKLLLTLAIAPPVIMSLLAIALVWYNAFAGMSLNVKQAWGFTYLIITISYLLAMMPVSYILYIYYPSGDNGQD